MKQRAYIKPTKPALIAGMIAIAAMFVFGVFFISLLIEEGDSFVGIVFLSFWLLIIIVIGSILVKNYKNYNKNPEWSAAQEIQFSEASLSSNNEIPFDEKLKKLEELRKQNLISSEEYKYKRSEIMNQKW